MLYRRKLHPEQVISLLFLAVLCLLHKKHMKIREHIRSVSISSQIWQVKGLGTESNSLSLQPSSYL